MEKERLRKNYPENRVAKRWPVMTFEINEFDFFF